MICKILPIQYVISSACIRCMPFVGRVWFWFWFRHRYTLLAFSFRYGRAVYFFIALLTAASPSPSKRHRTGFTLPTSADFAVCVSLSPYVKIGIDGWAFLMFHHHLKLIYHFRAQSFRRKGQGPVIAWPAAKRCSARLLTTARPNAWSSRPSQYAESPRDAASTNDSQFRWCALDITGLKVTASFFWGWITDKAPCQLLCYWWPSVARARSLGLSLMLIMNFAYFARGYFQLDRRGRQRITLHIIISEIIAELFNTQVRILNTPPTQMPCLPFTRMPPLIQASAYRGLVSLSYFTHFSLHIRHYHDML